MRLDRRRHVACPSGALAGIRAQFWGVYIILLVLTCRFKSTEFCFHVVSRLFIMLVKYFAKYFVQYLVYSLEALGFVLAACCLHYPCVACCPLLAISFHPLLPVAYITLSSRVCACYRLLALSLHRLLPITCNILSSLATHRLHYP